METVLQCEKKSRRTAIWAVYNIMTSAGTASRKVFHVCLMLRPLFWTPRMKTDREHDGKTQKDTVRKTLHCVRRRGNPRTDCKQLLVPDFSFLSVHTVIIENLGCC